MLAVPPTIEMAHETDKREKLAMCESGREFSISGQEGYSYSGVRHHNASY
jgi:hypothetical protein